MSFDPAPDDDRDIAEALVREYLDLWNAGELDTIWARIYARDASRLPWDQGVMTAHRARIDAEGFDHTELLDLRSDAISPGRVDVRIRFNRITRDGQAMPPGERQSLYGVERCPEGWRIAEMRSLG